MEKVSKAEQLRIPIMFPGGFTERIITQDYLDPDSLLRSLQEPSPVSIMTNRTKWSREPFPSEPVPWCTNGFYLPSRPSFTLDPLLHSGCYYPREASGMFLEQVFRQAINEHGKIRALDLCGAPGGKSLQISDLIKDEDSMLISNEVIKSRASVLSETITKWGNSNVLVTQNDPSAFTKLEGYFNIIVVDAPCSGEGMFRNNIAVEQWSAENAFHCSVRQKRILSDIWPSLAEDGVLVYSTCTFNPAENEEIINWLIQNHDAECIPLNVTSYRGIKEIDYNGIRGYGFYPGKIRGEGFFISVIRKTGKVDSTIQFNQKSKQLPLTRKETEIAGKWMSIAEDRIVKLKNEMVALPCKVNEYFNLAGVLNIIKPGTAIAHIKGIDFLPTHELVLSDIVKSDAFPLIDVKYDDAIRFLRKDNIQPGEMQIGWNIITYRNVNLGLMKSIGSRSNNYFPISWRIRMEPQSADNQNIIVWDD